MTFSFRFGLEEMPIPSMIVDLSAALRFRRARSRAYAAGDITPEEVRGLLKAALPVAANTGALELFGVEASAALNDPNLFREEFVAWFVHLLDIIGLRAETPWAETVVFSARGEPIPVVSRARCVVGPSGELDHALWSFIDVSALKQAEADAVAARRAAEDASEGKSIFLATMSHEIRTPLNGVLGMAQALDADVLSDVQRERVGVIRESGQALLAILNDVLDLSKIEAGKLELEAAEFDLAEISRGAHATFTALANKKSLSFSLDIQPAATGRYFGDATRIRQILYNLISNSLKFTEQGEIRVDVSCRDDELRFAVTDTGIGIPSDRLSELFSKFTQVDSSTTRRFGGTGLGLAICRELAELMDGRIEAQSAVGEGSRFTLVLTLPRLGDATADRPVETPVVVPVDAERARAPKVLAAEDNSVNRLVLKTLLHQVGIEPLIVCDGHEVVAAWQTGAWDLVLMDIQMPGLDGIEATRAIRAAETRLGRPRTPIIALSANVMVHQIAEYAHAGMDGHVAKPIDVRKLLAAIERAVSDERTPESAIYPQAAITGA